MSKDEPKPNAPPLIPVKRITFEQGRCVDLGAARPVATGLTATGIGTGQSWVIWYDPRLRHHRVERYEPGADLGRKPTAVLYIPEAWCCWEAG